MSTHTSRAVRIDEHGGPDKLKLVDVTVGEPGPGERTDETEDEAAHHESPRGMTSRQPRPLPPVPRPPPVARPEPLCKTN